VNIWMNFTPTETRVFALPHSVDRIILSLFVWVQYHQVTDRQTDRFAVAKTVQLHATSL